MISTHLRQIGNPTGPTVNDWLKLELSRDLSPDREAAAELLIKDRFPAAFAAALNAGDDETTLDDLKFMTIDSAEKHESWLREDPRWTRD